jgi:heat shock protein HtpX
MEKVSFQDQISSNKRNSIFLMLLVIGFLAFLGYFIGWFFGSDIAFLFFIFAIFIAIIQIFFSYYYSDTIVLASVKARPATRQEHRYLMNLIEGLSIASGLPKPRVYVIESEDINAFATGRDPEHAVIVVTTGALKKLNRSELEGVMAHEMSHIRNYDIRFATLVAVLVGIIAIVAQIALRSMWWGARGRDRESKGGAGVIFLIIGLIFAILAPISAKLVQLAISRRREYLADASGVELTRYPKGLADALEKIKHENKGRIKTSDAVAHMFISNPMKKFSASGLFSTHPPIDDRIKRLKRM